MTRFVGTAGTDWIFGTSGRDVIYGQAGDDALYGRQGDDVISGFTGNDWIFGEEGSDRLLGGDGDDVIESGGRGRAGEYDNLSGGDGNDRLYIARSGAALANGGAGNDELYSISADSRLLGASGNDQLIGYNGGFLSGGVGDDSLAAVGNAADLRGGPGNDRVFTFLEGYDEDGATTDLTGNAGVDMFSVRANAADCVSSTAIIHDYHAGEDRVELSAYDGRFIFQQEILIGLDVNADRRLDAADVGRVSLDDAGTLHLAIFGDDVAFEHTDHLEWML